MALQDKPSPQPPIRVGISEFRGHFSDFIERVRQGASFVVTSRDEVVALVQPPQPRSRRQPGTLRGKIQMTEDFDTLPADVLAAMEGDGE